jgi:hypothetical protein
LRIFKTKWFDRFARKNDIDNITLIDAVERARKGSVDANLGSGVIKQRIAREGRGKAKGYRAIIVVHYEKKAFFVFGFSKNDQENLEKDEEDDFKKMSKHLLALSDNDLSNALARGDFIEVRK